MFAACHGCLVVLRRLRLRFGLGGTCASPCVRNDVVRPTGHHPLHPDTHCCCRYLLLLSALWFSRLLHPKRPTAAQVAEQVYPHRNQQCCSCTLLWRTRRLTLLVSHKRTHILMAYGMANLCSGCDPQ